MTFKKKIRNWFIDSLKILKKEKYASIKKFYNLDYTKRMTSFSNTDTWKQEIKVLLESLNINSKFVILDYGCNKGGLIKVLDTFGKKFDYIGVDINRSAIKKTIRKKNINFYLSKHNQIPDIKRKLDVVIFSHSIAHIENPDKVLRQISSLLKSNGVVGVITPNYYFKLFKVFANLFNNYKADKTVLTYYKMSQLKKLFKNNNFFDIKTWYYGESALNIAGKQIDFTKSRIFLIAKKNQKGKLDT